MEKNKSKVWAIIQVISSSPQFWMVVGTMLTTVWAWAKGWFDSPFAPLTIPVILIVVALTFYVVKQLTVTKSKRGLTELSPKELQSEIRNWVDVPAWSVQPQPLQSETMFAYEVQYKDIHIAVVREKPQPSIIVLITKFTMRSEKTMLSEVEWQRLGSQLSIELARFGIEWDFIGESNTFESIELIEPVILDDSLTQYYFRSRIMFVVRARILAHELWKEALRQSGKSTLDKEGSQP
ncbi:MAG: hypothetical protein V1823_01580 [Chloroflexota bacterium]